MPATGAASADAAQEMAASMQESDMIIKDTGEHCSYR